ncbi:NAD(P)-dependent oxidoreductase [Streptomonospora nanhaiensis]|uniref:NAD(P)-dependent oxidoreductase n=1 Tax=Streptomonospora nanhaiensis TaxID=1323731 RepID=UPI001C382D4D|nr:NAD(P)-dependent oxidoreductase [Streptomonospora nanhaiensis]MBV2361934.1 NAD(P)-dependent oxidoreductase [Streptomonospora nanhaiensis]
MQPSTPSTPPAEAPRVAVLGTGTMGAPMARNIAAAGMPVRVWNRTRAKAEPLAGAGIEVAGTLDEAVADADIVVTMLYDGDTVEEVMAGIVPPAPGAVWAQTTTVGLAATNRLAARAAELGMDYLDAPVLGTRGPAEQGALTVLAAGPERARRRSAPVFSAIGARTVSFDQVGAASRLKLVANSWVLALTSATAEALSLAEGLGVDARDFLDVVSGGPLDSGYLHAKAGAILSGDYTPSFSVANAAKDANLVLDAAAAAGVHLDLAAASARRFARAAEAGHGDADMAAGYHASFIAPEESAAG